MKGIEIINASAGSGKTHNLTERVIKKLQAGLAPESLMAITFTNKAAAELRERIRSELLKNNMPDEAQRILDGFVGTVNAVCARLLGEYALDAGLSPALDVMPEEDSDRLFSIAILGVIDKYAGSLERAAKRMSLVGGSGYGNLGDWRKDVQKIVDLARTNRLGGDDLRECGRQSWASFKDPLGEPLDQDLNQVMDKAVGRAIENLAEIENPKGVTTTALKELKDFAKAKRRGLDSWSEWVRLSKTKPEAGVVDLVADVNDIAASVLQHPEFQSDMRDMITGVFECAAEALDAYETFKHKQGLMDFVDQETKVLDLARGNEAFRSSISERLNQMMVDEFQDTNPIQLAVFLELNNLAGSSTWVGDPKQTIYGFRGADPQLMDEVTKLIKETSTLENSWRSCERLVEFTNAVFTGVFHEMERDKVCLHIPAEREEEAKGGWLEAWQVPNKKKENAARATAAGVRDLLKRRSDIAPADIAVLCFKHTDCELVAASLEAIGIRASATQGSLMETRECQLAVAALKYLHDQRDAIALAEIVSLSPLHSDNGAWLTTLMQERRDALEQWRDDPLIVALDQARASSRHWTPVEALEQAIDRVDLTSTLKTWPNAALRMSNLDLLRGKCVKYLDQCRAHRSAATTPGFLKFLKDTEPGRAQGTGEQTVQVSTYHSSKGLEWPVVILTSLDKDPKGNVFGTNVLPAPEFNPAEPLANRSIRYWPWPFGRKKKFAELEEILADREEQLEAQLKARRDHQRLMYVAMTRAKEGLIFAMKKKETQKEIKLQTKWLDILTDASGNRILSWPLNTGEQVLEVRDSKIPVTVRAFSAEETGEVEAAETDTWLARPAAGAVEYPRARISPSGLELVGDEPVGVVFNKVADLGRPIELNGSYDGAALGSAIHGFLGADISGLSEAEIQELALGILKRWGVDNIISAADLLAARDRLMNFIQETYPEASILTEWPVTLMNGDNQLLRGWIDMLLELPEGYVIIDHKSYTAADAEKEAWRYAPQLCAYRDAVEKATGKAVLGLLLHMPVAGTILRLAGE